MYEITNIDIIPSPSGCGHATLRVDVDGVTREVSINRASFKLEDPGDVLQAVLNRIRSHILEVLPNATPAQIRADLQTRSFKI